MSKSSPSAKKRLRLLAGLAVVLVTVAAIIITQAQPAEVKAEAKLSKPKDTAQISDAMLITNPSGDADHIPEADKAWLKQALAEGKIRPARAEDKKAWEALAKEKGIEINAITQDYGRTFVIIKPIEMVEANSGFVTFIVSKGIKFPKKYGGTTFYNMNNGGWFSIFKYDDGNGEKMGRYPHEY